MNKNRFLVIILIGLLFIALITHFGPRLIFENSEDNPREFVSVNVYYDVESLPDSNLRYSRIVISSASDQMVSGTFEVRVNSKTFQTLHLPWVSKNDQAQFIVPYSKVSSILKPDKVSIHWLSLRKK